MYLLNILTLTWLLPDTQVKRELACVLFSSELSWNFTVQISSGGGKNKQKNRLSENCDKIILATTEKNIEVLMLSDLMNLLSYVNGGTTLILDTGSK